MKIPRRVRSIGGTTPGRPGGPARGDAELIQAAFDRELDDTGLRELFDRLEHSPSAAEDFARTQRVLGALGSTPDAPDLTERVLRRVERRRTFLSPDERRAVRGGRLVAAAALVALVAGVALVQRSVPGLGAPDAPRVITRVVNAATDDAQGVARVQRTIREVRGAIRAPLADMARVGPVVRAPVPTMVAFQEDRESFLRSTRAMLLVADAPTPPELDAPSPASVLVTSGSLGVPVRGQPGAPASASVRSVRWTPADGRNAEQFLPRFWRSSRGGSGASAPLPRVCEGVSTAPRPRW